MRYHTKNTNAYLRAVSLSLYVDKKCIYRERNAEDEAYHNACREFLYTAPDVCGIPSVHLVHRLHMARAGSDSYGNATTLGSHNEPSHNM